MKKLLPFLLVLTSTGFSLKSQTSTYYPMLADSNVWAVYMDVIPILLQNPHQPVVQNIGADYVYKIKDTIVDSMTYTMFYSRTNEGNPGMWSLLREDTLTQQVFLYSAGDTAERIIYDFSLNNGDSIWLDFSYQSSGELQTGWWYVFGVNVDTIAAGPRKVLYLWNPNNPLHFSTQTRYIQWIESVGCNVSPVYLDENTPESISPCEQNMGPGCSHNTHLYSVTCAWQDGVQTYSSKCWENVRHSMQLTYPNGDTCIFMMMGGVNDLPVGLANAQLFPNPADGSTTLSFNEHHAATFSINITNVLGQTVRTVAPMTWYAGGVHEVPIDLTGLEPGMYFVNLVGEHNTISVRLMVD